MIDCGADWLNAVNSVSPTAIVLTHAHDDHAYGLAKGVSCPVYATDETWSVISSFPIAERRSLTVTVTDDGVGLSDDWSQPGHYGLRGLGERVGHLGGRLTLRNQERRGTLLLAEIPLGGVPQVTA